VTRALLICRGYDSSFAKKLLKKDTRVESFILETLQFLGIKNPEKSTCIKQFNIFRVVTNMLLRLINL